LCCVVFGITEFEFWNWISTVFGKVIYIYFFSTNINRGRARFQFVPLNLELIKVKVPILSWINIYIYPYHGFVLTKESQNINDVYIINYLDIPWKDHGPNNTIATVTRNIEINVVGQKFFVNSDSQ
jgi:hypothetical protein